MKKVFTLLCSLCMAMALAVCTLASAKSDVTHMTNAAQVAKVVFDGYNLGEDGSIQIAEGKYTSNRGNSMDVYVVFVSGTENEKQFELANSGLSLDFAAVNSTLSPYLYRIKTVIHQNIPKGSRIILVGHSLGGMMTQQLAIDDTLKDEYIIKYDLCFAAPLTNPNDKHEGKLRRLGDWSDVIPFETINVLTNTKKAVSYNRENGGYGINFWEAHMNSYMDEDTWGAYDVTGKKGGKATLDLDMSTRTFYKSDYSLIVEDLLAELS